MSFIMKKKRYKFEVSLSLDEVTEISYGNAVLFAKVRQIDGGSFTALSDR